MFAFTKIENIFVDASYCYEVKYNHEKYQLLHCVYHQSWQPWVSRLVYVYSSLLLQYLVPTIIVVISYAMIYRKIKISDKRITATQQSALRKMNRRKRTNCILTTISIVFFVSWAPLNILNVIINTENPFKVVL